MVLVAEAAEPSFEESVTPQWASVVVDQGSAKKRTAYGDEPDAILFFGGEQHGSMDTCGCAKAPRGGFPRTAKMVRTTQRLNPQTPVMLVNIGGWLNDTIGIHGGLRIDAKAANEWMLRGLVEAEWTVVNVGFQDLPYLDETRAFPPMAVSANLVSMDDSPVPQRMVIMEYDGLRIGITGVSGQGLTFIEPVHYRFDDPVASVTSVVAQMVSQVDLVVVLGYGLGRQATDVARIAGVDVFIEGDRHHARYPMSRDAGALWLRSRYETQVLGELRLWRDGPDIVRALERRISLDDQVGADPQLQELLQRAELGVNGARRALLQPIVDSPKSE